ncbi:MAG: hypothetical protein FWG71_04155, partial [Synergistaceae bacterium]|nr:hypothetical protein [Synergistaceae bacterium]
LYCEMENEPENWELRNIFRVRTQAGGLPIALTHAFEVVRFRGLGRWLFGGTSDLLAVGIDQGRQKGLYNREQYIFALKDVESPSYDPNSPPDLGDLYELRIDDLPGEGDARKDAIGAIKSGVEENDHGWCLRLAPANETEEAEYVSASPHFNTGNNVLYVATFTPDIQAEGCDFTGYTRLYAFDPTTGAPVRDGGNGLYAIRFNNVKVVGITSYTRQVEGRDVSDLYLAVKPLSPSAAGEAKSEHGDDFDFFADDTIWRLSAPPGRSDELDLDPVVPHMQYWRETF